MNDALAEVRRLAERQLSAAEFDAYVRAPMGDYEREETMSLVAWFTRRYPSALERLRAIRGSMQRAEELGRAGQVSGGPGR